MKRFKKSALALAVAASLLQPAPAVFANPPDTSQPDANANNQHDSDDWDHDSKQPPGQAKKNAMVTLQPSSSADSDIHHYLNDPDKDPLLTAAQLEKLLQKKIKYVFVIFNENHSFDNEYGTFPGVNGLYSDGTKKRIPASNTQTYIDVIGNQVTVQPFRIGPDQNSSVVDSVDHSHTGLATKIDVDTESNSPTVGVAKMDQFAAREYSRFAGTQQSPRSPASQAEGKQFANLVMSHIDCDTIPFFWDWASHFTIFDNIFATEDTPSTPNAIAMIAGQAGETQWVKHPSTDASHPTATGQTGSTSGSFIQNSGGIAGANNGGGLSLVNETSGACPTSCPPKALNPSTSTTQGPPLVNDPQPYYGSPFDSTPTLDANGNVSGDRQPYGPYESYSPSNIASNLTFASVALTLMGNSVEATMGGDLNPTVDLADIQGDIDYIQGLNQKPVGWTWYQNGYGKEASDDNTASHYAYVSHHQGPQYFGYLANNPAVRDNLKGETDFFTDIADNALPNGGVFYIRGGYINQMGLTPPIKSSNMNPQPDQTTFKNILAGKSGDDDHPGYTDRQISEAMAARVINAIASNKKLWGQSAIVITYDESDGFYDHVPPRILSYGPDGLPLSRGVRIPLILISPYARTHAVSHAEGDHNSVIETINAIFNLPPLASLPDEADALDKGNSDYFNGFVPQALREAGFEQEYLGPRDINSPITDSLLSGFDPKRLLGISEPLPASFAMIPDKVVHSLPHYGGQGCRAIGITPVDLQGNHFTDPPPAGFNNLPSTYPAAN